jgi:hypothetical protein
MSASASGNLLSASQAMEQEVARLAQRLECMERAFLMSPTEALQDDGSAPWRVELCAQFVEVLERGREARNRELGRLEKRMEQIECRCSDEALNKLLEEQFAVHSQNEPCKMAQQIEEAIQCERAARHKDVADLQEALRHERVMSSTGGTAYHSSLTHDVSSEVALAVEAAMASSAVALSRHVAELHQQLEEELVANLHVTLATTTSAFESHFKAVSDSPFSQAVSDSPFSPQEALSDSAFSQVWPQTPQEALHASAADIADEGFSPVVQPHVRRIAAASRSSLPRGQKKLLVDEHHQSNMPISQGFGPGCVPRC